MLPFIAFVWQQMVFLWHLQFHINGALLWHHFSPIITMCTGVVGFIKACQTVYAWFKHPESFPGSHLLLRVWQEIHSIRVHLFNLIGKYLRLRK